MDSPRKRFAKRAALEPGQQYIERAVSECFRPPEFAPEDEQAKSGRATWTARARPHRACRPCYLRYRIRRYDLVGIDNRRADFSSRTASKTRFSPDRLRGLSPLASTIRAKSPDIADDVFHDIPYEAGLICGSSLVIARLWELCELVSEALICDDHAAEN
jgi:hypothetical protein